MKGVYDLVPLPEGYGAFYMTRGGQITMNYLLLHLGVNYMVSGAQGQEDRFVEVDQDFHHILVGSRCNVPIVMHFAP
jgi:hypothetical protein